MNIKTAGNKRFLYNTNTYNVTAEEKIAWLNYIIDNEIRKPDKKIDTGLVNECLDYIDELSGESPRLDNDELALKLSKITSAGSKHELNIKPKKTTHLTLRTAAIIAVIIASLFATLSIIADVEGYSSTWEFIVKNAKTIFKMEPGSSSEVDGVSIHKPIGTINYDSMDELIEKENLDILYPTWMPEGVQITNIQKIYIAATEWQMTFIYNDTGYNIFIRNYYLNNIDMAANREVYEYNGMKYYIKKVNDQWYQAYCQHDGYEYSFKSADYDSLIKIINNMKGLPK